MMARNKPSGKPDKKCWSESHGVYGATIRVAEREPGSTLYLLWLDKKGKQQKRSLKHRDRQLGKKQALALANAVAQASGRTLVLAEVEQKPAAKQPAKPLTLAEGVEKAFDPQRGLYPGGTRHAKQARTLLDRALVILGERLAWAELTPGTVLSLVRTMARESTRGKGARLAEYTCVVLYAVATWLRGEGLIPETAALPRPGWKTKLKEEWRVATGRRVVCRRPRHTVDEVAAIFAALPQGDPRLRLLVELAAELRAGQAVRGMRSDLSLKGGGFALGRFVVHGAEKKHGEVVDLHPELRELVDEVLSSGYLAEAEAAFQRGEIEDYYLFPAGKLRGGSVPLERATKQPVGTTAIRKMFLAVEAIAEVEHVVGRAFYGLRRQATDLAPEFASDARVLNTLSGHLDSATRERIYQERENERSRARAAETRMRMRRFLREQDASGGEGSQGV
jgi:integrase